MYNKNNAVGINTVTRTSPPNVCVEDEGNKNKNLSDRMVKLFGISMASCVCL